MKPYYKTKSGRAYLGDCLEVLKQVQTESVDLVVTSPPYALHFKKEYGNASQTEYVDWFLPIALEIKRIMKPTASFVLNIGGTWTPKIPTRSLYVYKLVLALCESASFHLLQEFFWFNPARMPAPAEWVNVRRIRVKDSVEYIFWFGKDPFVKADNRRILREYSKDMQRLIKKGVKNTVRPSGHVINESFSADKGGSIPPNIIIAGNNESNSNYIQGTKAKGQKVHPARFPGDIPRLFIEFLTNPGDVVLDPFAGSNTTGFIAEQLGRQWIAVELSEEYLSNSQLRFKAGKQTPDSDENDLFAAVGS